MFSLKSFFGFVAVGACGLIVVATCFKQLNCCFEVD